jgi:hypothetical protein
MKLTAPFGLKAHPQKVTSKQKAIEGSHRAVSIEVRGLHHFNGE